MAAKTEQLAKIYLKEPLLRYLKKPGQSFCEFIMISLKRFLLQFKPALTKTVSGICKSTNLGSPPIMMHSKKRRIPK